MSAGFVMAGAGLAAVSGLPGMGLRSRLGGQLALVALIGAAGLSMMGMYALAADPDVGSMITHEWSLPVGHFAVGLDALSTLFLVPILLIGILGAWYGLSFWPDQRYRRTAAGVRLWWGLLVAAMMMIVLARDAVVFLMAWEVMALAGFLLISTLNTKAEVRKAAWIYQVAAHLGSLFLIGFFALLRSCSGSFDLWPALSAGAPLAVLFTLGFLGFGMKAGLFPLHVWLPGAHASAPSHVSAILSGVMLKMGVYGLLRMTALVDTPPIWWGGVLLGMGSLSAVLGIAYAVGQRDYKKLLAYSSIENIGIITLGVGLALLGRSAGRPEWVVLGMSGALLHVLNHSLFKPMLFMGAGNLLHAVHTRDLDRLGGLGKVMPRTYMLFLLGAVAICGLPPMNGFVSELLIYLGLLKTTQAAGNPAWGWAALAAPVLAAVGALAVAAFVKLIGGVFQGESRHGHAQRAHEAPGTMLKPLAVLAALCLIIGIAPIIVLPALQPAVARWAGMHADVLSLMPAGWQAWLAVAAAAGALGLAVWWLLARKAQSAPRTVTWDCGYARPNARMQYTSTSFAQMIIDLFLWALFPTTVRVKLRSLFPQPTRFARVVPDVVLERLLLPAMTAARRGLIWLQGWQQGSVQAYLLYVLVVIVLLVLVG